MLTEYPTASRRAPSASRRRCPTRAAVLGRALLGASTLRLLRDGRPRSTDDQTLQTRDSRSTKRSSNPVAVGSVRRRRPGAPHRCAAPSAKLRQRSAAGGKLPVVGGRGSARQISSELLPQVDKRERSLGASAVFDVPGSLSKCQVLRHLLVGGEDQVSARRVIATTASRYWREIGAVRSSHR
jgi:hypothetical protein